MDTHYPGEQRAYAPGDGRRLRYLLYLPPAFAGQPHRRWPMLCFLHGSGEAARDARGEPQPIDAVMHHGSPAWHAALNSPLVRDFIVLSPQRQLRGPWDQQDLAELATILQTIYQDFRGNPRQTHLSGFSLGGRAVFDFAGWAAEAGSPFSALAWASLWPVDDATEQPRQSVPVRRLWLHFGTWRPEPQRGTAANLGLVEARPFRPLQAVGRLYTDYGRFGYDHTTTCAVAYADWRVYAWLLGV